MGKTSKNTENKKGGRFREFISDTATLVAAAGIGVGAAAGTAAAFDAGKAASNYFTATEKRREHFWSLPKEVYCWNGKPVNKKKGGVK